MVLFIYIYVQLIVRNHTRLQSYLTLSSVYKTLTQQNIYFYKITHLYKDTKGDKITLSRKNCCSTLFIIAKHYKIHDIYTKSF